MRLLAKLYHFLRRHAGCILKAFLLSNSVFLLFSFYVTTTYDSNIPPVSHKESQAELSYTRSEPWSKYGVKGHVADDRTLVLVILLDQFSNPGKDIMRFLSTLKIRHDYMITRTDKRLVSYLRPLAVRYDVIVMEDPLLLVQMPPTWRTDLYTYCQEYDVRLIEFVKPITYNNINKGLFWRNVPKSFIEIKRNLSDYMFNVNSSFYHISKPGQVVHMPNIHHDQKVGHTRVLNYRARRWITFNIEGSLNMYEPLVFGKSKTSRDHVLSFYDPGTLTRVRRVVIGGPFSFFMNQLVFLDALRNLTDEGIAVPLKRHLLVDIDDVFKSKLSAADVEATVKTGEFIRKHVPNFRFNLGFCGGFYHRGPPYLTSGDVALIAKKHMFWWFPHTFKHSAATMLSYEELIDDMVKNRHFAELMGITVEGYAVSPFHSGIYPVEDRLYRAWIQVWNISTSSAMCYTRLDGVIRRHAGFSYRGIEIMPRFYWMNSDRNWRIRYKEESIFNQQLLQLILTNYVNILVTHGKNYAYDRPALHMLPEAMEYIKRYTHLELRSERPLATVKRYFSLFPNDRQPLWKNPCSMPTIVSSTFWKSRGRCEKLPDVLITGADYYNTSEALLWLLRKHPMTSGRQSPLGVASAFFSDDVNYRKGFQWYTDRFPPRTQNRTVYVDRDMQAFSNHKAITRMCELLPDVHVIVLLDSLRDRLSICKKDPLANCEFREMYSANLREWITQYRRRLKILVLGTDEIRERLVDVSEKVHQFLKLTSASDIYSKITYDPRFGIYCHIEASETKDCIVMKPKLPNKDVTASHTLLRHIRHEHTMTSSLLKRMNIALPVWLQNVK